MEAAAARSAVAKTRALQAALLPIPPSPPPFPVSCRVGNVMEAAAARSAATKTRALHAALLPRAVAAGREADRHSLAAEAARGAAHTLLHESGPGGRVGDGSILNDSSSIGGVVGDDGGGFEAGTSFLLGGLPPGSASSARGALHSLVRMMSNGQPLAPAPQRRSLLSASSRQQQPTFSGGDDDGEDGPQLGMEEEEEEGDGGSDDEVLLACTQAAILSSGR